jgi:hypothetical protein
MQKLPTLFVVVTALLACSSGQACSSEQRGRPGEVGVFEDAGNAGSGGQAGIGNAGTSGAVGSGGSSTNALSVGVQDIAEMKIEILTLQCAGDCADIEAVARGGNAPYTFAWEDGSTDARRRVCLDASAELSVSATDTAIDADEFHYDATTATAQVSARVLDCEDGGTPNEPCDVQAPPGSFDPIVKWSWNGSVSMVTPLVANLTDDNDDGRVDLEDTPDVLVIDATFPNTLVLLDGKTGDEHFRFVDVFGRTTPALGDIDGDQRTDIVMALYEGEELGVYRADLSEIWRRPLLHEDFIGQALPLALADLDADGSPEIIAATSVFSATGDLLWSVPFGRVRQYRAPTAADLDGDGFLEVIWGEIAFRHDGELYYDNDEVRAGAAAPMIGAAWVAIADLDRDGVPEICVSTDSTLFVLDHAGTTLRSIPVASEMAYPPAIADLDGDGVPEIVIGNGTRLSAYEADLSLDWSMPVNDTSGVAAATAFDFLGDGSAEAMYGDETTSWAFDGIDGQVVFMEPRSSSTLIEYPTVADVDNDGSADILITSQNAPGLRVLSDRMNRWAPARRIMNQETYHVTNVNEDGTIPQHEAPHWKLNNTFRAQAQVNGDGGVCVPRP